MALRKLQYLGKALNDHFPKIFDAHFAKKFGVKTTTRFNIFSGDLITVRDDGLDLTPEQYHYSDGYSDGYAQAMSLVNQCVDRPVADVFERAEKA